MKFKKNIFTLLLLIIIVSCNRRIIVSPVTSTAAFNDLGIVYERTDPDGKDYFQVFGRGNSIKVCRNNAKLQLIKTLVYDGISKGVNYPAILNDNKSISTFKDAESSFIGKWIDNESMIGIEKTDYDQVLSQSDDNRTQYSAKLIIGINRLKLKNEVLKSLGLK